MDKNTYQNLLRDIDQKYERESLSGVLTGLETLAGLLPVSDAASRIFDIKRAYQAMLNYYRTGAEDSDRQTMYSQFLRQSDSVWWEYVRHYLLHHSNSAYAETYRVLEQMNSTTLDVYAPHGQVHSARTQFEQVWTSDFFTDSVMRLFEEFFRDESQDDTLKQLLVSALTLSALEVYDVRKLQLLIQLSRHAHTGVKARAMMGMVFIVLTHRVRVQRDAPICQLIQTTYDNDVARQELVELQMQLLISMETQKIAQTLSRDILPEMLRKNRGKIPTDPDELTRLNAEMAELGLNPDWENDKQRSQVGKKIRRLIEMQEKGADVYISSFAMLKGRFPFFKSAANWFMPYSPSNPEIGLSGSRKEIATFLAKHGLLCDSDKYSISLLFTQMPDEQFQLIAAQLQSMIPEEFKEQSVENSLTTVMRCSLQDFYRFAMLYPHRDARLNPFSASLLFVDIAPFSTLIGQGEMLQQIATFAFEEKNYTIAYPLIERLLREKPTARLWQMAGYCQQCVGHYEEAVKAYDRSGLFGEQSAWTIRQLAACHRAAGHFADALTYYDQMAQSQPDDVKLLIRRAQCLEQIGRVEEALELLHKADYLEEIPAEGARELLQTLFHASRFEAVVRQSQRFEANALDAHQRLIIAHATWLSGDTAEAVARYKGAYARMDVAQRAAHSAVELLFGKEQDFLLQNGKTKVDLQIMADAVSEMQK
ncbi:MAG: tetratricopeptide repeat protein [Bacteroidaceae bacterium]|nr:tetratricopeptide repeat protein [Bacteroidaceae bacterium]